MGLLINDSTGRFSKCTAKLLLSFAVGCGSAYASDYGTTGLIDIPTARMQSDGSFRTTAAFDGRHRSFAITYQTTPWLEGPFVTLDLMSSFFGIGTTSLKRGLGRAAVPAASSRWYAGYHWNGGVWFGVFEASKGLDRKRRHLGVGWGRLAGKGNFQSSKTGVRSI